MDPIKEAFQRIKEDILNLKNEISEIKTLLAQNNSSTNNPTIQTNNPTIQTNNPTIQTNELPLESLYSQNTYISTGNRGVQTDRQTDQQTDKIPILGTKNDFNQASKILESLSSIKKEIRKKFKILTPQEMLVFTNIYALSENDIPVTYKALATKLGLSESSIRDYTNNLIRKGIPVDKIRQNNKTVLLNISQNLKNIATLETILELRDL